jgi:hypothetical protein
MSPPPEAATMALDRAAVEALEKAAQAATPGPWDMPGGPARRRVSDIFEAGDYYITPPLGQRGPVAIAEGPENAAFISAANPHSILQLIADWRILDSQNALAFNHNKDLGEANDELRLRVHRLERALREIADSKPWSGRVPLVAIARVALEGSAPHG